jgi:hypothetical protein
MILWMCVLLLRIAIKALRDEKLPLNTDCLAVKGSVWTTCRMSRRGSDSFQIESLLYLVSNVRRLVRKTERRSRSFIC